MQRLNQVVSNFHTKAALIILHARAELSPAYSAKTNEKRVNKWFNIELDETDDYIDDIRRWKKCDVHNDRPPPLIIEVYLTTEPIAQGQRLVILDDEQKRWDVYNALEPKQASRNGKSRPTDAREILLERWTIALDEPHQPVPTDLTSILPHVYKKSILLFRALYTYCNFLPAWKLIRKLGKSRSTMGMKVGFRIVDGDQLDSIPRADNLTTPLYDSRANVVTDYSFGSTDSPAGPFSVQVRYRSNCDFRIDDSEELLSSRFIVAEDEFLRPSLARGETGEKSQPAPKVGSLPTDQRRNLLQRPELGHAYGSLSTFHQAGISPGTSPISALRAAKDFSSDSPSPQRPLSQQAQVQPQRPPITNRTSTPGRRSSFLIQPFKTPALAASPLGVSPLGTSPRISTRAIPTLDSLEEESSVPPPNAQAVAARKPSSVASDNVAIPSTSSSPRPAPVQRFTSSFSHRKNRPSLDRTANKTDDDQTSSGKASAASSGQPGSGLMIEAAGGGDGSSGSMHEDDENISDFLKMLDLKKDLLIPASSSALDASARKTAAALTRFHKMRDSNAALSESMASSLMVPKTTPSPSRTQTGAAALSTSSSPGKPISPHTPHTPFAPSRLSAAYSHDDPDLKEELNAMDDNISPGELPQEPSVTGKYNRGAIDIPNSPKPFVPGYRRSNSAQRHPLPSEDEISDLYGIRSASMGPQNRNRRQDSSGAQLSPDALKPLDDISSSARPDRNAGAQTSGGSGQDGTISNSSSTRSSLPNAQRLRSDRAGTARRGSHASPGQGSLSSVGGAAGSIEKVTDSGASSSWTRGGRTQGLTRPEIKTGDDDDFLPFVMDASTFASNKGESRTKHAPER